MRFALIGAAGYIAPRHMAAIKSVGGDLVAAYDPNDSVGILDQYFPNAKFFTEFERFDRHLDKLKRRNEPIDYLSVCSPNYLHDSHVRFGLRSGANVICEKPLVLSPWNIEALEEFEQDFPGCVSTILQLRLHPSVRALRERLASEPHKKFEVDLKYVTSRGNWYLQSWKGDEDKSGGIAANIGVHFFDMLHFLFGEVEQSTVLHRGATRAEGELEYTRARVKWSLSINEADLPSEALQAGRRTHRAVILDGEEFEFSGGFADLHNMSYAEIVAGRGFGLRDNYSAIKVVHDIRFQSVS